MQIRFTRHAEEKFVTLQRHGVKIYKDQVLNAIGRPEHLDSISRAPLYVAQVGLDVGHVLRVVYRIERDIIVVITFYPGRKSHYEY